MCHLSSKPTATVPVNSPTMHNRLVQQYRTPKNPKKIQNQPKGQEPSFILAICSLTRSLQISLFQLLTEGTEERQQTTNTRPSQFMD